MTKPLVSSVVTVNDESDEGTVVPGFQIPRAVIQTDDLMTMIPLSLKGTIMGVISKTVRYYIGVGKVLQVYPFHPLGLSFWAHLFIPAGKVLLLSTLAIVSFQMGQSFALRHGHSWFQWKALWKKSNQK